MTKQIKKSDIRQDLYYAVHNINERNKQYQDELTRLNELGAFHKQEHHNSKHFFYFDNIGGKHTRLVRIERSHAISKNYELRNPNTLYPWKIK